MDLHKMPVIDAHCHLFDLAYEERDLAGLLSLSLEEWNTRLLRETLVYKRVLRDLAAFFEVENVESVVLSTREKRCREDYAGYVKKLFEAAGIKGLVIDLGYKPAEVDIEQFKAFCPCRVHYVYRIETLLDRLWTEKTGFDEALELFRKTLEEKVDEGVVAFKSIMGYRTGLNVTIPGYREAKTAYEERGDEKTFRDYFFNETIKMCKNSKLPFQIHAAFGESNADVLNNNPLLLKRILDEAEYKDVTMVLVHGGYPYSFEAGYLAAMYPNLYLDFSEMNPWLTFDAKNGLKKIIDMAPFCKIMYGSDGFVIPELHYMGAVTGKKMLGEVIDELVESKILNHDEANELAHSILHKNAEKVFKLPGVTQA